MRQFIYTLLFLYSLTSGAQSVTIFSIDNGGASTTVGNLQVLYTIGEVNVQELSGTDLQVSEGFINGGPFTTLSANYTTFISSLELYPNPTSDIVFIKGNTAEIKQIEVYTILGQSVLVKEQDFDKMDISALQPSVYIVKLYNQSGTNKTIRLVKY